MPQVSRDQVLKTIAGALQVGEEQITEDTSADDLGEWDSIGHLGILSDLDQVLDGAAAEIEALASADSVSKILSALGLHGLVE